MCSASVPTFVPQSIPTLLLRFVPLYSVPTFILHFSPPFSLVIFVPQFVPFFPPLIPFRTLSCQCVPFCLFRNLSRNWFHAFSRHLFRHLFRTLSRCTCYSGEILCEVVNAIRPGTVPEIHRKSQLGFEQVQTKYQKTKLNRTKELNNQKKN